MKSNSVFALVLCLLATPLQAQDALDTPAWRQMLRDTRAHAWSAQDEYWSELVKPEHGLPGYAIWDFLLAVTLEESDPARSKAKFREAVESWHPAAVSAPGLYYTHDGWAYPCMHAILKPHTTPEELAAWEAGLKAKIEFCLGWGRWGPNTRLADTDLLVGHFGLVLNGDLALGTEYCKLQSANAVDGTPSVGCSFDEMLAAMRQLLKSAKGGEWIESSQYNLTSNATLIMGMANAGWPYPEFREYLDELGEQMRWHHTPDLRDVVQWGDDEKPHQLTLHHRYPLYCAIIGMGGDKSGQLRHIAAALYPTPDSSWGIGGAMARLTCDPRLLPTVPKVEHPVGLRQSANGLLIFRTPTDLVQVFCPNNVVPGGFIDHQQSQWDVRWWHKGEWVQDHPISYMPSSKNHNGSEGYGLQLCLDKRMLPATLTPKGFRVEMETSGPHVPQYLWEPPPSFTAIRRRSIEFDGQGFDVGDSGDQTDPKTLPYFAHYLGSKPYIENALAPIEQFWHTPPGVEPASFDGGFTWLTRGGTRMRLTTDAPIRKHEPAGEHLSGLSEPGGFLMRLGADKAIKTRVGLAVEPVPGPPPDVEVRGLIRTVNGKRELVVPLP